MSCSVYQSLFDSDSRIWEEWRRLNKKKDGSASEIEELHRLARVGGDSKHAVTEHIASCLACRKPTDETDS